MHLLMTEFGPLGVTLCSRRDVKIQVLANVPFMFNKFLTAYSDCHSSEVCCVQNNFTTK